MVVSIERRSKWIGADQHEDGGVIYLRVRSTHDAEMLVRQKWRLLKATMDERHRRLWAGAAQAGKSSRRTKLKP